MILSVSSLTLPWFIELGLEWRTEQESHIAMLVFSVRYLTSRGREEDDQQGTLSLSFVEDVVE